MRVGQAVVRLVVTAWVLSLARVGRAAGRSLVPYLAGKPAPEPRFSYAELDEARYLRTLPGEVDGVRIKTSWNLGYLD